MLSPGINRNIVECKDHRLVARLQVANGINRNIVECKEERPPVHIWYGSEY